MDSLPPILNRRRFLANTAKAGLVLGAPGLLRATTEVSPSDTLNVAVVGCGRWGSWLLNNMRNIPGIRVQAVCDIWEYSRKRARSIFRLHQNNETPNAYLDLDEMLEKESGLDAAIIATPDFWHAPHAVRCMEAGLHVYCESMMAHTIEAAREIVRASERTRRLCQIGHYHRSSAVHRYVRNRLLHKHRVCGNIHNINSQWNISIPSFGDYQLPRRWQIEPDILKRHGYADMNGYLNWQHKLASSQGRLAMITARQMDMIHWFLDTVPKSVTVTAGRDFFKQREHFDNLMCVFQYETPQGSVRAFHQSLTSVDDPEAPLQKFMGTEATIRIAEFEPIIEIRNGSLINDSSSKLSELARRGIIRPAGKTPSYFKNYPAGTAFGIPSEPTYAPIPYELPGKAPRPAQEAHLMNFFDAIHGRAELNCDARTAFQSEAAIYWLHAAAESGETMRFTPEQLAL